MSRGSRGGRRYSSGSGVCGLLEDYVLVIAEKPKAAAKIAEALGNGGAVRCRHRGGAPYWVLKWQGEVLVVGSAAGHLFGLTTRERGFPVFSYEWRPLWEVEKGSSYVKPFYEALRELSRGARLYVNACDYDIEGSVIGFMVIKWFGDVRRARRAKFSALTRDELRRAFSRLGPLDFEMVEAGLARHELDWIWGVNVSRALMDSVKAVSGRRVILSAGRVQSPTLIEAVRRDLKRRLHVPLPSYAVEARLGRGGWSRRVTLAVFQEKPRALGYAERIRGKEAVVEAVERRAVRVPRPYPFNLGDLQAEAARLFGYSPYFTQSVAEELYLDGLISYPRTNSQRLPSSLDYGSILRGLARAGYSELVEKLVSLTGGALKPRNGPKEDPAHPAIYPTGEAPRERLEGAKARIYDLIVKRFLATLSKDAVMVLNTVVVRVGDAVARISGRRLAEPGWVLLYQPYAGLREEELPPLRKGDRLAARISVVERLGDPPSPYTKASLVKWMEQVGLGTEATRARIVELLFRRGYLERGRGEVRATELGIAVAEVLEEFFSELTSVELTRSFEALLEDIRRGRRSRGEVVEEAKRLLREKLESYRGDAMRRVGLRLSYSLGLLEPPRRCVLCGRPTIEGARPLCKLHAAALETLREGLREWLRRSPGAEPHQVLRRIASSRKTGSAVSEVAEAVLSGKLSL